MSASTMNVAAATPLNSTAVAPVKLLPTIETSVPSGPLVGVKLVIAGAGGGVGCVTVNESALVAVPLGVVTAMGPLVAPAGTLARMRVSASTMNVAAAAPLNSTAVAPVKLLPTIETSVPSGPLVGVKLVIAGAGGGVGCVTVNESALVAVPLVVVTAIGPLVAPAGTLARMRCRHRR
ncbi:MAG: hypothetical protein Q9P14_05295 [candidate division KSB1 bacterium]|nr:hypothetical protein [candidate division KSB1 bacterium]